jgi:hypothetical protein
MSHQVSGYLERQGILERDGDDCMDAGGRAKQEPEPRTVTETWRRVTKIRCNMYWAAR